MVSVAQYNLGFDILFQLARMHAFDRAERTHGHENRRFDSAVGGFEAASARFTEGVGMV